MGKASYLDRYLAGEYESVWDELMALGAAVREKPLYADALAVARETMRRARFNCELLVERLERNGYKFDKPEQVFIPPSPNISIQINELEQIAECLPLSMKFWHQLVGAIDLCGTHPHWKVCGTAKWHDPETCGRSHRETEPIQVDGIDEQTRSCEDWHKRLYSSFSSAIIIGGDRAERSGYSGAAMWMEMPNYAVDGWIREAYPVPETFVQYLRRSFLWGGFPGFANVEESLRPTEMLAVLTEGLLPI